MTAGDRLIEIDGTPYKHPQTSSIADAAWADWEKQKGPDDRLSIVASRKGETYSATINCIDGQLYAEPLIAAAEDLVAGRWDSCLYHSARVALFTGPSSVTALLVQQCWAGRARSGFEPGMLPKLASADFEVALSLIREAQFSETDLDTIRPRVMELVSGLRSIGYDSYAKELEDEHQQKMAVYGEPPQLAPPPEPTEFSGTCFAVRNDGTLLTAAHVVKGASTIEVSWPDGESGMASVVFRSPAIDVAVLQVARETPEYLPLAPMQSAAIGAEVFTIGYPAVGLLGEEPKFTNGTISALSSPGGERSLLQISVPIQPGNSGGPLVNEHGEVVGIVIATAAIAPFARATGALPQNLNWAVNADFARPLVKTDSREPPHSREGVISRAKQSTCLVRSSP